MMGRHTNSTQHKFFVGKPTVVAADSPTEPFGCVFEDDGETGYFYAWDFHLKENNIVDALHIYNVGSVIDRDLESVVEIVWLPDRLKALLRINGYAHAVFDFSVKRGYCRNNYPNPPLEGDWASPSHEWNESVLEGFPANGGNPA
jgi:hypothetical protein